MAQSTSRRNRRNGSSARQAVMTFSRTNYVYLIACLALVVLGYVLMRWENAVDGVISLYVAPLMLLAGYLGVIYAILWQPRAEPEADPVAQAHS